MIRQTKPLLHWIFLSSHKLLPESTSSPVSSLIPPIPWACDQHLSPSRATISASCAATLRKWPAGSPETAWVPASSIHESCGDYDPTMLQDPLRSFEYEWFQESQSLYTQQLLLHWLEMPQFQQALGFAPPRRLHPFQRILGVPTGFGARAPHPSGQILDPRPWSMESTASLQDFMEQLLFGGIQLAGLEGVTKTGTKRRCWWCTSLHVPPSLHTYVHQY